jgi:hypothetical protein
MRPGERNGWTAGALITRIERRGVSSYEAYDSFPWPAAAIGVKVVAASGIDFRFIGE